MLQATTPCTDPDPVFEGWLRLVRTFLTVYGHAPLGDARPNAEAAVALFNDARAHTARAIGGFLLGWANLVVGDLEAAIRTSRQTIEIAQRRDIRMAEGWAVYPLGAALILAGDTDAGVATLRTVIPLGNRAHASYKFSSRHENTPKQPS